MSTVLADLRVEARWIIPMTVRGGVLENQSVVVRDGRILDILPSEIAAEHYQATAVVQRPGHLLMPGMVNTHTHAAHTLFRAAPTAPAGWFDTATAALEQRLVTPEFVTDGVLSAIAEMLRSGVTCFADRYYFPRDAARAAMDQGMRAVIGIPIADLLGPRAHGPAEYFTEGLRLRDEYRGHPLISTVFAPQSANAMSDATFGRIATLADELDAGIMMEVHESAASVDESIARHGSRPIDRLWKLGLLTPAFNALNMAAVCAEDIELARRTGIGVSLCPETNLRQGQGLPPLGALAASGIRIGVGSAGGARQNQGLWSALRLLGLIAPVDAGLRFRAWDSLAMATRGGAAVLGLDSDLGTLEKGKWADLCCIDMGGPEFQPVGDPLAPLVFCAGPDAVTDVWVAGRQLLSGGELTRMDWPAVAARAAAWGLRMNGGE